MKCLIIAFTSYHNSKYYYKHYWQRRCDHKIYNSLWSGLLQAQLKQLLQILLRFLVLDKQGSICAAQWPSSKNVGNRGTHSHPFSSDFKWTCIVPVIWWCQEMVGRLTQRALSWSRGCETLVVRFEEVREHSLQIVHHWCDGGWRWWKGVAVGGGGRVDASLKAARLSCPSWHWRWPWRVTSLGATAHAADDVRWSTRCHVPTIKACEALWCWWWFMLLMQLAVFYHLFMKILCHENCAPICRTCIASGGGQWSPSPWCWWCQCSP